MVFCLISNLFIPINQACNYIHPWSLEFTEKVMSKTPFLWKLENPGVSPGEWLFSDSAQYWKREAYDRAGA